MLRELNEWIEKIKKESKSKKRKTALAITVTTQNFPYELKIFPIRYLEKYICLPVGIKNDKIASRLAKYVDGKVDVIFVDAENKLSNCKNIFKKIRKIMHHSKIYPIKGNDFTADATFGIVCNVLKDPTDKKICIIGAGNIGSKVALKLLECGAKVYIINSNKNSSLKVTKAINALKPRECVDLAKAITKKQIPLNLDCIIGFTRGIPVITKQVISKMKKNGVVIDGGSGTISTNGITEAQKKNLRLLKVDTRYGFLANTELMIKSEVLMSKISGIKKFNHVNMVAGGVIGKRGDMVVDDISKPTRLFGVADGKGGFLVINKSHDKNLQDSYEFVKKHLGKR